MHEGVMRIAREDGLVVHRSSVLDGAGVPHLFSTRHGIGGATFDARTGGEAERLVRSALGGAARVHAVRQVHGADVHLVEAGAAPVAAHEERVRADALVTRATDACLLVQTADCVPVLVADGGGRALAAVHAGWRGLVAGILPAALARLADLGAEACVAAVGPCLSSARFEVGPEVAERFVEAGLGATIVESPGHRPHVDLGAAAALQLERAGVVAIDRAAACTWEDGGDFWSYRRDVTHGGAATTGRMVAVIGPAAGR